MVPFGNFYIPLPQDCINECSNPASSDKLLKYWARNLKIEVDPLTLRNELQRRGTWSDAELMDFDGNLMRIVKLAACSAKEQIEKHRQQWEQEKDLEASREAFYRLSTTLTPQVAATPEVTAIAEELHRAINGIPGAIEVDSILEERRRAVMELTNENS